MSNLVQIGCRTRAVKAGVLLVDVCALPSPPIEEISLDDDDFAPNKDAYNTFQSPSIGR